MNDRDKLSHNYFAHVKELDEQLAALLLSAELDFEEKDDNSLTTFKVPH